MSVQSQGISEQKNKIFVNSRFGIFRGQIKMPGKGREPNWKDLVGSWDKMQEYYLPNREQRFDVMLDALEASLRSIRKFRVVDLGCGPGSLSSRVLERFPQARVVAVDYDPVVLTIARHSLQRRFGDRITWLDADISKPSFEGDLASVGGSSVDAAISTTALHWLYPNQLRGLYRILGNRLARGGIFENGDSMPGEGTNNYIRRLSKKIREIRKRQQGGMRGSSEEKSNLQWSAWWKRLERDPYFDKLFKLRKERFPYLHSRAKTLPLSFHERALKDAGFRMTQVVWQDIEDRVLLAIK